MRSFEIFVEPQVNTNASRIGVDEPISIAPRSQAPASHKRIRPNEVLDLFIHGANVTARVAESHASCVLRDLAVALGELAPELRGKRIVRFYDDAWELCVERLGRGATLSVYRGGAEPTVLVYDRPVVFAEMCASVVDAIDATLAREPANDRGGVTRELALVRAGLLAPVDAPEEATSFAAAPPVSIDVEPNSPLSFSAEFALRAGIVNSAERGIERADLHALLVRGPMRAEVRGRAVDLGTCYPFLFAERLLDLSRRALDSWERGQPFYTRIDAGGIMLGLRSNAEESPRAALTLIPAP